MEGAQKGASTQSDGTYELSALTPGEQTLVASFVGYETARKTVTLQPGQTATVDFALASSDIGLEEMVVTALGVSREERSLGYSVERVSGSDLAESREANVMNSLSGRVAGLDVISGSAGSGEYASCHYPRRIFSFRKQPAADRCQRDSN